MELLRAEQERGGELSEEQQYILDVGEDEFYCRPCLELRDSQGVVQSAEASAAAAVRESTYNKNLNNP